MTLADALLLALLAVALLGWWLRRRSMALLAALLALVAALYDVWDDRWQAGVGAVVALLLVMGLLLQRKRPERVPLWPGLLFSLLSGLAVAALYFFPVSPLPMPGGPYQVGVRDFELVDASRTGLLGAPVGKARRLLVRAWYPARPATGAPPRTYFSTAESRSTARGFGELLHFPPLLTHLRLLRTHSYENAPLRSDPGRLPVVFYSHGYGSFAGMNGRIMEELASHGYAVYSVQHTGDASPTLFPNGEVAPTDPALYEHLRDAFEHGFSPLLLQGYGEDDMGRRLDGQLRFATELKPPADRAIHLSAPIWLADRLFVHDRLQAGEVPPNVADLVAASDFSHVGEMGMSFGGSTTGAVCMVDKRCAAAVNLDGGDFDFTPFDEDLPVPLLMLHSDLSLFYRMLGLAPPAQPRSFNDFSYERIEHAGQNPRIHRLVLRDALHAGLTDNALYMRRPLRDRLIGSAPTDVLIEAPATLVLGFFDHYLRGRDNNFPQAQMAPYADWLTPYSNRAVSQWWAGLPEAERARLQERIRAMRAQRRALDK
ncbi:dienelactone hydrolase [Pseudomonas sp. 21]|uniref:alpha/beta hydrolase family protein n=1 Tax=unclassified Pseudomonas TaxID=196821 RepID=UPI0005EB4382|nr:dienelactone hydrolase [Pseudomonas sp. 21]KJK03121.1 dienelactone hydrolase [Pseudomonas sp. 21]MBV7584616.1 hypothetical protein [Pseudomonas sp. PDM33]